MKNEIVIFALKKNITTVKILVNNLNSLNLLPTIVAPLSDKNFLIKNIKDKFKYISDEEIEGEILNKYKKENKWIIQQLLKIQYWINSNNNILIIDGDTIIKKERRIVCVVLFIPS